MENIGGLNDKDHIFQVYHIMVLNTFFNSAAVALKLSAHLIHIDDKEWGFYHNYIVCQHVSILLIRMSIDD